MRQEASLGASRQRSTHDVVCRVPRITLPRTWVNRGHQGSATGFGEYLHDDEHLVTHAGLLPLLLSAIPNDESLEVLRHILLFPDERRVGLAGAGGPITHLMPPTKPGPRPFLVLPGPLP